MQSKFDGWQACKAELNTLTEAIAECVKEERWEDLPTFLTKRQQCLETLCSANVSEDQSEELSKLAATIMEQDNRFVAAIQQQQKLIEAQIGTFDKGRLAVHAYNNV